MSEQNTLSLARIRTDGGTQTRAALNPETVKDYAEAYERGEDLPPVVVFYDGTEYWLADGFHRVQAMKDTAAPADDIPTDIHQGTQRDAILYSVQANAAHGLPRSNEDKRRAVLKLLDDDEWTQWSDRKVALQARVSHTYVANLRRERGNVATPDQQKAAGERAARVTILRELATGKKTFAELKEAVTLKSGSMPEPGDLMDVLVTMRKEDGTIDAVCHPGENAYYSLREQPAVESETDDPLAHFEYEGFILSCLVDGGKTIPQIVEKAIKVTHDVSVTDRVQGWLEAMQDEQLITIARNEPDDPLMVMAKPRRRPLNGNAPADSHRPESVEPRPAARPRVIDPHYSTPTKQVYMDQRPVSNLETAVRDLAAVVRKITALDNPAIVTALTADPSSAHTILRELKRANDYADAIKAHVAVRTQQVLEYQHTAGFSAALTPDESLSDTTRKNDESTPERM